MKQSVRFIHTATQPTRNQPAMLTQLTRRERNRQQAEQIVARISLHLEIESLIRSNVMHCTIPEEINTILEFDSYEPMDFPEVQEYIPDIPEFDSYIPDVHEFQWEPVESLTFAPLQGKHFSLQCVIEATRAGLPYQEVVVNAD
jgi:hypothetical protein